MPECPDELNTWMSDTDESEHPSVSEYNIAVNANDFNSTTIASYMESGVIKLPFFQRHFVWERPRASRLIESLILGLPVPQIFLYEQSKHNFLILDGQQRLLSIFFFIKKRFPKKDAIGKIRESFLHDGKLKPEIKVIKAWLKERAKMQPETDSFFVSERRGPLSRKTAWVLIRAYGKKARLPLPAHPHMLRHACGFALADQGADTRLIQDYLGHRNIQHTVMYTASNPARFERLWR